MSGEANYMIIRFYDDPYKPYQIIKRGLTLEQAKAHCNDPKTSTNGTKPFGQNWFDGFSNNPNYLRKT